MSESAEWVLVPQSLDDETLAQLVKEPVHLYGQDGRGEDYQARMKVAVIVDRAVAQQQWRKAIAARPSIPPEVLDAMVERGARAMWPDEYPAMLAEAQRDSDKPNGASAWHEVETMRSAVKAALRAALGISE